jgi:hypothetical protein
MGLTMDETMYFNGSPLDFVDYFTQLEDGLTKIMGSDCIHVLELQEAGPTQYRNQYFDKLEFSSLKQTYQKSQDWRFLRGPSFFSIALITAKSKYNFPNESDLFIDIFDYEAWSKIKPWLLENGCLEKRLDDKVVERQQSWREIIPNKDTDWKMLEMWEQGYQSPQIALSIGKDPSTVLNRLSSLRTKYPEANIENRKRGR